MSKMNEKVEEPQEQASDRAPMPDEELQKILEAHRMWVESEGKDGERADLLGANLQEADLFGANLQKADLLGANLQGAGLERANLQRAGLWKANLQGADLWKANLQGADLWRANLQKATLTGANLRGANLADADGLTAPQVKPAKNWELAFYSDDFLRKLGLPSDHNGEVEKKLAELKKKKKATGAQ